MKIKERFRGVRQSLKRARAYLDRKFYTKSWKTSKKRRMIVK